MDRRCTRSRGRAHTNAKGYYVVLHSVRARSGLQVRACMGARRVHKLVHDFRQCLKPLSTVPAVQANHEAPGTLKHTSLYPAGDTLSTLMELAEQPTSTPEVDCRAVP